MGGGIPPSPLPFPHQLSMGKSLWSHGIFAKFLDIRFFVAQNRNIKNGWKQKLFQHFVDFFKKGIKHILRSSTRVDSSLAQKY
jgi:hypothetical protein